MPSKKFPNSPAANLRWHNVQSAVLLVEELIAEAVAFGASDLHFIPGPHAFWVRMRVDGMLQDPVSIPESLHSSVMARLKVLAGLRTDEHQLPQDGRFLHTLSNSIAIDVRLSLLPTHYGENAVIRLLTQHHYTADFESLGFTASQTATITTHLARPHGMILLTGPTGSGKTTTLYAILQQLTTRPLSIITIEDPVEYSIPGIVQVPIRAHAGLDFALGLRSILRQDPDVLMIGEIRDAETAQIATRAALTGHLVLATLHTTDSSSALTRLKNLGVEPYLIASTVSMVIAQRLARSLCRACISKNTLSAASHAHLLHVLGSYGPIPKTSSEAKGCTACNETGYAGRVGIYEFLSVTTPLKEALLSGASEDALRSSALEGGMTTLQHEGLLKVREGITSYEEVLRITYA